jgi:hypothetical protein
MSLLKTARRLGRCAFLLALAIAIVAPAAQARHIAGQAGAVTSSQSVAQPPPRIIVVNQRHGFDFGAASIGAAGAVAAVLIASGVTLSIKRKRTRNAAEPSTSSA